MMNNSKDSLGDRMKAYEVISRNYLTRRTPVIIRLDGVAFHTLLRNAHRPFDTDVITAMQAVSRHLLEDIQGAYIAYTQSDEITLVLQDYRTLQTDAWFGYNVQKIVSNSASKATLAFNNIVQMQNRNELCGGIFDARAFNIPPDDVLNNLIWRQRDWNRNSLAMVCQAHFSHRELHGKNSAQRHEMLYGIGVNWATDCTPQQRNGTLLVKDLDGNIETYFDNIQDRRTSLQYLIDYKEA